MRSPLTALGFALLAVIILVWATPLLWMLVASVRPESFGGLDMASLLPNTVPVLDQFAFAFQDGEWATWFANSLILVGGTLAVQLVTISLAGYAFAGLHPITGPAAARESGRFEGTLI